VVTGARHRTHRSARAEAGVTAHGTGPEQRRLGDDSNIRVRPELPSQGRARRLGQPRRRRRAGLGRIGAPASAEWAHPGAGIWRSRAVVLQASPSSKRASHSMFYSTRASESMSNSITGRRVVARATSFAAAGRPAPPAGRAGANGGVSAAAGPPPRCAADARTCHDARHVTCEPCDARDVTVT
jgi:hypothetical protein